MSVLHQILLAAVLIGVWCLIFPPPVAEARVLLMGLRPNRAQPQPRPAAPRCYHHSPPVPVHVYDTLDGSPELVGWLCPDCLNTRHAPPPPGIAAIARAGISVSALIGERGPELAPDPDIIEDTHR